MSVCINPPPSSRNPEATQFWLLMALWVFIAALVWDYNYYNGASTPPSSSGGNKDLLGEVTGPTGSWGSVHHVVTLECKGSCPMVAPRGTTDPPAVTTAECKEGVCDHQRDVTLM
jgi:hypothetical protein